MRRLEDLSEAVKPAPIGHNGGPPLDVSWNAWAWRRAHAKAWASPGREIVMLRLRRAERLGLSYRQYTGVLMDRGAHLGGLVVTMDDGPDEDAVMAKLAMLNDCHVLVCAPRASAEFAGWLSRAGLTLAIVGDFAAPDAIRAFSRRTALPPSALFLAGPARHRKIAERLGLGLFVEARDYFGTAR